MIDIGVQEFAVGLTYVGLSRVRSIKDLLLIPFHPSRLKPTDRIKITMELQRDFLTKIGAKQ